MNNATSQRKKQNKYLEFQFFISINRLQEQYLKNSWFSCDIVIFQNLKTTFPSEVLLASDKRSYRNLTFDNVLARRDSSFCNRARLNL